MKLRFVLAASSLLFLHEGTARAAPDSTPPSAEQRKAAQKMFEAGDALYEAGRYEEAIEAFRQSHSLVQSPNSRLMLARSLRDFGKAEEACVEFRGTRDDAAASGGRYPEALQAATAELAALESAPTTRQIVQPQTKPLNESPKEPAHPAPPVSNEGDASASNPLRTAAWVSAGVGTLGTVGFAVFGYLNYKTHSDLDKDCPNGQCQGNVSDRVDNGRTYQFAANISLAVALLGAGAATTLFVFSTPKNSSGPAAALNVGPGAIQLNGHF